ncbi:MAG TPA: secondary thiamine-phosphate synthase enzyme YjbQ [Gaiellaceae bacterium]|nr:secondary thiamine-phosphate synthase enzyme YjbQ [Gaiellaceae bacterium]
MTAADRSGVTVRHERIDVRSRRHVDTVDVTERIANVVRACGIRDGICSVTVMHTTAGIFINENADPDVQRDLIAALERIVPDDERYAHAEGNSPGHIKSSLVGVSVTIPIRAGSLDLGTWQGVFLAEFDGPRDRHATVSVIGEAAD